MNHCLKHVVDHVCPKFPASWERPQTLQKIQKTNHNKNLFKPRKSSSSSKNSLQILQTLFLPQPIANLFVSRRKTTAQRKTIHSGCRTGPETLRRASRRFTCARSCPAAPFGGDGSLRRKQKTGFFAVYFLQEGVLVAQKIVFLCFSFGDGGLMGNRNGASGRVPRWSASEERCEFLKWLVQSTQVERRFFFEKEKEKVLKGEVGWWWFKMIWVHY